MKTVLLSLVLLLISGVSHSAFAKESCKYYSNDPFELNARMPKGPLKGACLNLVSVRNLNLLSDEEAIPSNLSVFDLDKFNVVANFFHKGQYWYALVPKKHDLVKRAIFQVEYFPVGFAGLKFEKFAAHTQMRFDMNEPIYLVGQNEENLGLVGSVGSVIISFEATFTKNSSGFNLAKGNRNYFALSARFASLDFAYNKVVVQQKHLNEQIELNLTDIQANAFFRKHLWRADQNDNQQEMYNTLRQNCTTEIFKTLDDILGIKRNKFTRIKELFPSRAREVLDSRGLVRDVLPSLEDEFSVL